MTLRRAIAWTVFWILLSMTFAMFVYFYLGADAAVTWLSCYIVEKLLSFDNLFMFYVIFNFLGTSPDQQRRALNWGLIGVVLMRGAILLTGSVAIIAAPWLLYIFGGILLLNGLKILFNKARKLLRGDADGEEAEGDQAPEGLISRLKRWLPAASIMAITILTVELTDIIFALDSLPAAFAITANFFLLATSNLLAVLGLRSMYFVMLKAIEKFHFLETGVGIILSWIGVKMLIAPLVAISNPVSFGVILGVLALSILLSAMKEIGQRPARPNDGIAKKFCSFFFRPPLRYAEHEIEMQNLKDIQHPPTITYRS